MPRLEWNVKKIKFTDLDIQLIFLEFIRSGFINEKNAEVLLKLTGLDLGKLGYGVPSEPVEPEREPETEIPEPEAEEPPVEEDEEDD